jgi:hypothetical protein
METRRTAIVRDLAVGSGQYSSEEEFQGGVRSGYLFSPLWKGLAQRGGIEGVLSLG